MKLIHGFRKFFKTQLLESHVETTIRKMLMGHDLKLDDAYDRPSFDFIVREYEKAIYALTVDPSQRLSRDIAQLKEERDEITLMKLEHDKEMKEMNQKMDKIFSLVQENPKLAKVKRGV